MTNQEFLIAALNDEIDDDGATREAAIYYHISCPFYGRDNRSECNDKEISREVCGICKENWLKSEVDE